jgi:hypothetical protein
MAPEASANPEVCEFCGADLVAGRAYFLEFGRPPVVLNGEQDDLLDYLDAWFCSQEHAAAWLSSPLPEPRPRMKASVGTAPRHWLPMALLGVVALALVGAVILAAM